MGEDLAKKTPPPQKTPTLDPRDGRRGRSRPRKLRQATFAPSQRKTEEPRGTCISGPGEMSDNQNLAWGKKEMQRRGEKKTGSREGKKPNINGGGPSRKKRTTLPEHVAQIFDGGGKPFRGGPGSNRNVD